MNQYQSKKLTVVLTGGIGSGKSQVAAEFETLGVCVVEQDTISREIVEPGTNALTTIREHFGPAVICCDGTLDRRQLRKLIFDDPAERRWLEKLLHPLVGTRTLELIDEAKSPYVLVVNPLLRQRHDPYDRVLVVDVAEHVQVARTAKRDNVPREQVTSIIATQIDRKARLAIADDIIVNEGSVEELKQKVQSLHQQYLRLVELSRSPYYEHRN